MYGAYPSVYMSKSYQSGTKRSAAWKATCRFRTQQQRNCLWQGKIQTTDDLLTTIAGVVNQWHTSKHWNYGSSTATK